MWYELQDRWRWEILASIRLSYASEFNMIVLTVSLDSSYYYFWCLISAVRTCMLHEDLSFHSIYFEWLSIEIAFLHSYCRHWNNEIEFNIVQEVRWMYLSAALIEMQLEKMITHHRSVPTNSIFIVNRRCYDTKNPFLALMKFGDKFVLGNKISTHTHTNTLACRRLHSAYGLKCVENEWQHILVKVFSYSIPLLLFRSICHLLASNPFLSLSLSLSSLFITYFIFIDSHLHSEWTLIRAACSAYRTDSMQTFNITVTGY